MKTSNHGLRFIVIFPEADNGLSLMIVALLLQKSSPHGWSEKRIHNVYILKSRFMDF